MLNENEMEKYNRQIIIPNLGLEGQMKLKNGKVLVIGLGGLGSGALFYLVSAGVGHIGILDKDKVELSNLNRQILYSEYDVSKPKTSSAYDKLSKLNSDIRIQEYAISLTSDNIEDIIGGYDFVIEASDNFETKFLVNDICVKLMVPFVIGGVFQYEGQLMTVIPGETPCYRCVFKEIPEPGTYPTTSEEGVMGTTAGLFGIIEANEAVKFLVYGDKEKLLTNRILYADIQYNSFETFEIEKNETCDACSK
ncbi:MAG: HesA/MoeB/ThiF family protein [Candidatus Heimdallarchaeota archaeon]|nr:HesA/MoeB/ThiF family protein [Candidatus Heimdallarchaeota archaeon]MCK4953793.1 HesA/MoeB/ThiF family protein [Candidatus Heimdallarchaeota archaeon]